MPEPASPRVTPWGWLLACGVAATALCGFGGIAAAVGGWLAQPAFALAMRLRRAPAALDWRRDLPPLLALWGLVIVAIALLLAWPLGALGEHRGPGAALALSAVAGLGLVGVWRTWPLWHDVEAESGTLSSHWQGMADRESGAWRGLGVAVAVLAILASVVAMAWPGLLPDPWRWAVAAASLLAWPLLHTGVQATDAASRVVEPAGLLDGIEVDAPAADLDAVDEADPDAALYAAARNGRVDRALHLLEAGADPHALPLAGEKDQRSLPVLAALLPDLRLLRALIAQGVDLNHVHAGMSPLLAATRDSWHGRPDAVMTLLANGADPRMADGEGNTPLHHAARSSDPGVAALLRDAAAELDVRNGEGITPLGVACCSGNWRLAKFLLERGAKAELEGATPALLPAAGGDEDDAAGVQLLLKHKARIDARDALGRSALHEAALAGHVEVIEALLAANADVQARDAAGRTPLLDAAQGGRVGAVDALAAAGADIAVVDGEGRGALALACGGEAPTAALVRRLLELGADPDLVDAAGKRPVDLAAGVGRWSLVQALDPGYALPASVRGDDGDVSADDRLGDDRIRANDAAEAAPRDRAPMALLREAIARQDTSGLDPALARLPGAAELSTLLVEDDTLAWPDAIDWLLLQGADAEARGADGHTALFTVMADADRLPSLEALLRRGASPAGRGGLARFLATRLGAGQASGEVEQLALELLERGADPFGPASSGDPPLTLAVRLGWMRVFRRLLDCGVPLDVRDSHGMTALHLSAALGREPMLRELVAHGADPDVRAADGQTPLGVALAAGRRDLAAWLDWRGWPLPKRRLQPHDLPAAAIMGDADAVRRLLDLGFDVDTPDAQGCSALLRAAGGGHGATVDLLLERGADPQRAANTGATPLSAAVSMRQGEIVGRLLGAGADLEHRLPGEVTVLMLASALGLPDVCARLLAAGANVHASDAQGLTPLHCVTLYGFTSTERERLVSLLDTLLLAGAHADAAAAGEVTPLLLMLGARAEPGTACNEDVLLAGLQRLLDEDISLDARDPRGFGPLHLSALHGLLRTTQFLLRVGADPEQRDALNRIPREIAIMRGFVDVAAEFEPNTTSVSMARFLREPR